MNDPLADIKALMSRISGSIRATEMATRLGQSLEITDGLWELVPVVVAAGEAHDKRSPAEIADRSFSGSQLPAEKRARLQDIAERFLQATDAEAHLPPLDESEVANLTVTEVMADPFGTLGGLIDQQAYLAQVLSDPASAQLVGELANAPEHDQVYLLNMLQASMRAPRTPVLLRALFVATVGAVEPLVTRYVTVLLYDAAPQSYKSMADPALEKKARDMCYGGPAKWRTALVRDLGVTIAADTVDWDRLQQLWEQRNVVVHRGGIGDSQYRRKTGTDIGGIVAPDTDAVKATIDEVGVSRYGLAAAVWSHLEPDMGGMISGGTGYPFANSFCAGRWRQAKGLATVQLALAADPTSVANAKVNRWLAIDLGLGPAAIRAEVEEWSVAELPSEYRMARHLLLREDDEGLALVLELLDDHTISRLDLETWSIFSRLRNEGKLNEFLNNPQAEKRAGLVGLIMKMRVWRR